MAGIAGLQREHAARVQPRRKDRGTIMNLVLKSTCIYDSVGDKPFAGYIEIEDNKIKEVTKGETDKYNDPAKYDLRDCGDRTITAGLIDSHIHLFLGSLHNATIDLYNTATEEEAAKNLYEFYKDRDDEWVLGFRWSHYRWPDEKLPTKASLDKYFPDRPVVAFNDELHAIWVNSKTLEVCGITKDTVDPDGGIIERDENGEPTGVLRENARDLVTHIMPETSTEETARELRELGDLLSSQGIVAVTDMGALDDTDNFPIIERAAELGLCQEVGVYYMWDHWMDKKDFDITPELMDRTRQVFVCGLKLIGDGSISGQTAWMDEPYLKADGTPRTDDAACGLPVCSDEQTRTAIEFCKTHGCQLSLHAMGNRAIERMLDFVEDEVPWTDGEAPYLRFEHVTLPSEQSVKRVVAKGIGIASQPIFPYAEIEAYLGNLGHERTRRCYPYRTLLDDGVNLCFSTDAPATSWAVPSDPFPCIKGAVTRHAYEDTDFGEDEAVDVETAITLYTREAARMAGFEGLGMLKPGMKASFAVLDRDIFSIPADEIDRVQVLATYVRGTCVYQREA